MSDTKFLHLTRKYGYNDDIIVNIDEIETITNNARDRHVTIVLKSGKVIEAQQTFPDVRNMLEAAKHERKD